MNKEQEFNNPFNISGCPFESSNNFNSTFFF